MGSLSADKAGVGSAVNDTTRELGGTLGVAIIGSVFSSIYIGALDGRRFDGTFAQLPPDMQDDDRGLGRCCRGGRRLTRRRTLLPSSPR